MVNVEYTTTFKKLFKKINNESSKSKIKKQIKRIIKNPSIGKPMRYERKGTRELYISPYRLAYAYIENKIIFLEIYHKDFQ